ncbi:protein-glutamate methylesterase/protein-glutamine glutaminase [Caldalkalibacillus salinus]|uniref:protein-glutamate methylesterase/protein-glutamine glutaminase n=1 Tax=Caldalkalibacillus salinus TaxID=2803787 RepID=UPI001F215BC8|nr:chemotaxis response regulator protein-glutamate methylesterase [Caldalkalibacillus salinus]
MTTIKVMVVDDSAFMRKLISDLLNSDPDIEVVTTSRNGEDCLDKFQAYQPDVITLDIVMPVLDGLETLSKIKQISKVPVIMLSKLTQVGADNTIIALEKGAFDFVAKPDGINFSLFDAIRDELIDKVKTAAQAYHTGDSTVADVNKYDHTESKKRVRRTAPAVKKVPKEVILMGSSTGGPKALNQLLLRLPQLEHTAVCIVQHMPPAFTLSLANRLNTQTDHIVSHAKEGQSLEPGHVYVAPGGYHLELCQDQYGIFLHLEEGAPRGGHRPSVDVMFESAMNVEGCDLIAVVLTGMGKDGTEGLRKLKAEKKAYAIAEHESSCVVYGMPRAVVEADLADEVRPLQEIHDALNRLINS